MSATWNDAEISWNSATRSWLGALTHLATWDDPAVRWNSEFYSWLGDPVLPASAVEKLRQLSVFAHVASPREFTCIETPRLSVRIASPHVVARIDVQRYFARV